MGADARMEIVLPKAEDNRRATAIVVPMRSVRTGTSREMASVAGKVTSLVMVNANRKRMGRAAANVSPNRARKVARRVAKKKKISRATRLSSSQLSLERRNEK
jgi:hypothetical protein